MNALTTNCECKVESTLNCTGGFIYTPDFNRALRRTGLFLSVEVAPDFDLSELDDLSDLIDACEDGLPGLFKDTSISLQRFFSAPSLSWGTSGSLGRVGGSLSSCSVGGHFGDSGLSPSGLVLSVGGTTGAVSTESLLGSVSGIMGVFDLLLVLLSDAGVSFFFPFCLAFRALVVPEVSDFFDFAGVRIVFFRGVRSFVGVLILVVGSGAVGMAWDLSSTLSESGLSVSCFVSFGSSARTVSELPLECVCPTGSVSFGASAASTSLGSASLFVFKAAVAAEDGDNDLASTLSPDVGQTLKVLDINSPLISSSSRSASVSIDSNSAAGSTATDGSADLFSIAVSTTADWSVFATFSIRGWVKPRSFIGTIMAGLSSNAVCGSSNVDEVGARGRVTLVTSPGLVTNIFTGA